MVSRRESHAIRNSAAGIKATPINLRKSMRPKEGLHVAVLECLAQVSGNLPAIRAREMEGVHQIRIGFRRLNVALQAFSDAFPSRETASLCERTKTLADGFADARDLDVFVSELVKPEIADAEDRDALALLVQQAEVARRLAWDKAVAEAGNPQMALFLDDVAAFAQGRPWRAAKQHGEQHDLTRMTLGEIAGNALDRYLAKAQKRGAKIKSCDEHDFHRLRITLKKLRYAMEIFEPLFRKKHVAPYLRELKSTLGLLGALHDVTAAREILKTLVGDGNSLRKANLEIVYAAGLVKAWHGHRATQMSKQVLTSWEEFSARKPFWH